MELKFQLLFVSMLFFHFIIVETKSNKKRVPKLQEAKTKGGDPRNHGFDMVITKKGLDYISVTAGKMLNDLLEQLFIPDVRQEIDGGFIQATNLHITKFVPPQYVYDLVPDNKVFWSIENAGVFLTGNWHGEKKIIIKVSLSGYFEATAGDVSISMTTAFGKTLDGKPAITQVQCTCKIGTLNLKIRGGVIGWIINLFKTVISNRIKPSLEHEICQKARNFILNDVNLKLQSYSTILKLKQNLTFDMSLLANPSTVNELLETKHSGQISYMGLGGTPFYPHMISAEKLNTKMVNVFASDYILNSFLYHAHNNGYTTFTVQDKNFLSFNCPDSFCLGDLLPRISATYPRNSKAILNITTLEPPTCEFSNGKATLHARGLVQIIVPVSSFQHSVALSGSVDLTADLKVWIADMNVLGEVDIVHFELNLINSTVRLPSPDAVTTLTDLVQPLLREIANVEFRKGIPLKLTKGVTFVNPSVQFAYRTLQIYTDMKYDPFEETIDE